MQIAIIDKIFTLLQQSNNSPTTELQYTNNFTLLLAIILSAQTTDVAVNKACRDLFIKYDTPETILQLGVEGLKAYIKTIGLYNNKAKNIILLCEILLKNHQGQIPNTFEELIKLPGVGRKTANVFLNCAFGYPTIAVDTHVFRVSKRIGFSKASTPEAVEKDLLSVIPYQWRQFAHHWLILHGRYVCTAKKPKCSICSLQKYCEYYNNSR
jgi:endonuclease-3